MHIRKTIALAALAVAVGACASETGTNQEALGEAAAGPATNSGNTENPPPADLNGDHECGPDDIGWVKASGTLTNHSSELSSYMISVNFADEAGTIYADAVAFVNNVPAGETAAWEAQSLTDSRAGTCTIVEVDRYAS